MGISLVVSTRRKPATCLKSFTNFIRNSFIEYIAMGRNQYYNFGVALISIDYIDSMAMYSIKLFLIKFVNDLRQVAGFLLVLTTKLISMTEAKYC
jgi:hypothetical protein